MKLKDECGQVLLSLTTEPTAAGDVIVLGGGAGTIAITIKGLTTTALDFVEATYDLELVSPSCSATLVYRAVKAAPSSARCRCSSPLYRR